MENGKKYLEFGNSDNSTDLQKKNLKTSKYKLFLNYCREVENRSERKKKTKKFHMTQKFCFSIRNMPFYSELLETFVKFRNLFGEKNQNLTI